MVLFQLSSHERVIVWDQTGKMNSLTLGCNHDVSTIIQIWKTLSYCLNETVRKDKMEAWFLFGNFELNTENANFDTIWEKNVSCFFSACSIFEIELRFYLFELQYLQQGGT